MAACIRSTEWAPSTAYSTMSSSERAQMASCKNGAIDEWIETTAAAVAEEQIMIVELKEWATRPGKMAPTEST